MIGKYKLFVYKAALIAVALLLMIIPGAADEMPQIDSRVMITSIGIDKKEDGLELTAAITVPSESGGKESATSVSGKTLGETLNNLSRSLGKRAGLSHCALVALGKELCERGVKDEIGYLVSSGGISDGVSVVVADGKAKDLISAAANLSENSAFSLGSFISFAGEDAQIPMTSLIRFAANNESVGSTAYLPILKMGSDGSSESSGQSGGESGGQSGQGGSQGGEGGGSQSGGEGGQSSGQGGGEGGESGGSQGGGQGEKSGKSGGEKITSSEKTMIFRNYRAVAEFDEEATFALTWLDPQADRGIINLKDFKMGGEDLGQFTFCIRKKGVSVKVRFDGDTPIATIAVRAQLEPHDSNRISELREKGFAVKEVMDELKKAVEAQLARQFKEGWDKAKQIEADPFKFGLSLFKNNPHKYDEIIRQESDLFSLLSLETDINLLMI